MANEASFNSRSFVEVRSTDDARRLCLSISGYIRHLIGEDRASLGFTFNSTPCLRKALNVIAASLVLLATGGCRRVEAPVPVANPAPKEIYTAELKIIGDASKLKISARAWYAIRNSKSCVPSDNTRALGGMDPSETVPVPLKVVSPNGSSYKARAYGDYFVDQVHFDGYPVCDWYFFAVVFQIEHNGRVDIVDVGPEHDPSRDRYCYFEKNRPSYLSCLLFADKKGDQGNVTELHAILKKGEH